MWPTPANSTNWASGSPAATARSNVPAAQGQRNRPVLVAYMHQHLGERPTREEQGGVGHCVAIGDGAAESHP